MNLSTRLSRHVELLSGLLFALTYVAARLLLELPLAEPLAVALALLPVPFFVLWLLVLVRAMRQLDELQQRIQLEAVAVAFLLALLLMMTLGLLELAVTLSPDDWSYRHVWAFLPLFYLLGLTLARRRYE
jgi:hypothetical protein